MERNKIEAKDGGPGSGPRPGGGGSSSRKVVKTSVNPYAGIAAYYPKDRNTINNLKHGESVEVSAGPDHHKITRYGDKVKIEQLSTAHSKHTTPAPKVTRTSLTKDGGPGSGPRPGGGRSVNKPEEGSGLKTTQQRIVVKPFPPEKQTTQPPRQEFETGHSFPYVHDKKEAKDAVPYKGRNLDAGDAASCNMGSTAPGDAGWPGRVL